MEIGIKVIVVFIIMILVLLLVLQYLLGGGKNIKKDVGNILNSSKNVISDIQSSFKCDMYTHNEVENKVKDYIKSSGVPINTNLSDANAISFCNNINNLKKLSQLGIFQWGGATPVCGISFISEYFDLKNCGSNICPPTAILINVDKNSIIYKDNFFSGPGYYYTIAVYEKSVNLAYFSTSKINKLSLNYDTITGATSGFNINPISFNSPFYIVIGAGTGQYNSTQYIYFIRARYLNWNCMPTCPLSFQKVQSNDPNIIANYSITVLNSNTNLPKGYQLEINISKDKINDDNLFNYIKSNPLNLAFYDESGNQLYAWIEKIGENYIKVFVKLSKSISLNLPYTIYMYVTKNNQYPYTGINPEIKSGYDNGDKVFLVYCMFGKSSSCTSNINYASFSGDFSPTITDKGLLMLNGKSFIGTYLYVQVPNDDIIFEEIWGVEGRIYNVAVQNVNCQQKLKCYECSVQYCITNDKGLCATDIKTLDNLYFVCSNGQVTSDKSLCS